MKLPFVRKYVVIAFHVTVTFALIYAIKMLMDVLGVFIADINGQISDIFGNILKILSVFSVIIQAFAAAYVLEPLTAFFQKKWDKALGRESSSVRTFGAASVFIILFAAAILCGYMGYKRVGGNLAAPIEDVNKYAEKISQNYAELREYIEKSGFAEYVMPYVDNCAAKCADAVKSMLNTAFEAAVSAGSGIADTIAALVIAFYFMRDKEKILKEIDDAAGVLLPKKIYAGAADFLEEVHYVFSGYIRGQLTDATIMALLLSVLLSAMGVDFATVIGVISAYANVIPYFGALLGLLLAAAAAYISSGIGKALMVAAAVLVLQQIDGIFIAPRIVGNRVSLSPLLVIASLTVFGKLFGIWGMVFAIPAAGVMKVYMLRLYERRRIRAEEKNS